MSGKPVRRLPQYLRKEWSPELRRWGKKNLEIMRWSVQFSSVAQSCPTLCDPMDCSTPGLPVHHQTWVLPKLMSIESVMPSNHLTLCRPLLLPPSIFPSIKVFSNKSVLRIRQPKYWGFSFNISPSNEHSGLISFRDATVIGRQYSTGGLESDSTIGLRWLSAFWFGN